MSQSESLPSHSAAVIIDQTGGREVLQYKTDVPLPELFDGQVLVKNEFIGINFIDTYFRTGLYPIQSFPHILGREAAGTVAAIAGANPHGFAIGDRVVFMATGTYAQYSAVPTERLLRIPNGVSFEDAAAAPIQGLTAWTMLHEAYEVKSGDIVLITAAAGGVGLWLVQMAKAKGATVIATASTSKIALVKNVGADHVIDYSTDVNFAPQVLQLTGGLGVHAVFDGVGKSTFDASLQAVRRKGTVVSFGNSSGAVPPLNILRLTEKNIKLLRTKLDTYLQTRQELEENANAIWDFILKDQIEVRIHKIYELKDVAQAHEDLEGRKTTGKLLLKP